MRERVSERENTKKQKSFKWNIFHSMKRNELLRNIGDHEIKLGLVTNSNSVIKL